VRNIDNDGHIETSSNKD